MTADLWQRGCDRLAAELPEQQFNTWIRPLPAADIADHGEAATVVSVRVPNRFKLDWIRNQYAGRIEAVLSELAGHPVRLDLTLAQRDVVAPPGLPARNGHSFEPQHAAPQTAEAASAEVGTPRPSYRSDTPVALPRHRLNASLTFDTLIPGRANQMARTAALHVAGAPGVLPSPTPP